MAEYFVDSGYLVALEYSIDQNHAAATDHWNRLRHSSSRLVSTDYVLDETVTFFNSRGYHAKAVEIGNTLLNSQAIELTHVDEPLLREAWDYFRRHQDKRYSLTDCISFVLMQQRGIDAAFTFDRHFAQAGFRTEPSDLR